MTITIQENRVIIDGTTYIKEEKQFLTVADLFEAWEGVTLKDDRGIQIQKWYYGYFVDGAWCATSLSYMLANLGLLQMTCGGRYQNVYHMNTALKKSCEQVSILERGDIAVFCWDKNFTSISSKHITSYAGNGKFIGGNQDGAIKPKEYPLSNMIAAYRPRYQEGSLNSIKDFPII